jgi:hypothetical protein
MIHPNMRCQLIPAAIQTNLADRIKHGCAPHPVQRILVLFHRSARICGALGIILYEPSSYYVMLPVKLNLVPRREDGFRSTET